MLNGSCRGNPRVPSSHGVGHVLSPSRALDLRDAVAQALLLGGNCSVSHTNLQEMQIEGIKASPWKEPFPSEGRIGSSRGHGYHKVDQHEISWAGSRGLYSV